MVQEILEGKRFNEKKQTKRFCSSSIFDASFGNVTDGRSLIVIASTDHEGNNSGDEYQQTFYVAETALMQAEKSLIDKMLGPMDNNGNRQRK